MGWCLGQGLDNQDTWIPSQLWHSSRENAPSLHDSVSPSMKWDPKPTFSCALAKRKVYQGAKNCPWYHHHPCIPCPTNHCDMFPGALTTAAPAQGWAQALWPICAVKNPCAQGPTAILASSACKTQDSLDAAWGKDGDAGLAPHAGKPILHHLLSRPGLP